MSNGRIKIDLYSSGEIVPAFECFDSVLDGTLDACVTWTGYGTLRKYPAAILFCSTPAFFDPWGYMTWFYAGGGQELLQEMYGDTLIAFPCGMGWGEGGGWSNEPITCLADYAGLKYRTVLFWGEILEDVGAAVVTLPGSEVVPSLERGTLDAAEYSSPAADYPLGFPDVADYYLMPGLHQICVMHVMLINNNSWNALPTDLQEIVHASCDLNLSRGLGEWVVKDIECFDKIIAEGATLMKYSPEAQKEILDKFTEKYDQQTDPMFQKVWKSQKEFLKVYNPYKKVQLVEAEAEIK